MFATIGAGIFGRVASKYLNHIIIHFFCVSAQTKVPFVIHWYSIVCNQAYQLHKLIGIFLSISNCAHNNHASFAATKEV
jgi:hypothetical protein